MGLLSIRHTIDRSPDGKGRPSPMRICPNRRALSRSPEKLQPPVRDVASEVALSRGGLGLPTTVGQGNLTSTRTRNSAGDGRQKESARLPRDARVPTSGAS